MAKSKCRLPEKLLKRQVQRPENDLECVSPPWASNSSKNTEGKFLLLGTIKSIVYYHIETISDFVLHVVTLSFHGELHNKKELLVH